MKAATGETTLTIITIIAIGAVLLFFWIFFGRNENEGIQKDLKEQWDNTNQN